MSIKFTVGNVYDCPDLRYGTSERGDWALFHMKAAKGFNKINVFASNPSAIRGAAAVKVVAINQAELVSKVSESTGKWFVDYNVTATLERAEPTGRKTAQTTPTKAKTADSFVTIPDDDEVMKMFGL